MARPSWKESLMVLTLLTMVNLLNYFDRYVPSATKDLMKEDLKLTDTQTGALFTSFVIMYMIVSPFVGSLADSGIIIGRRRFLIFAGVVIWCIATSLTGLMPSFYMLLIPRLLFGVGEAAYATLGPALLCDYFSPSKRNVALAIFLGTAPVGAAIGYGLAGLLGDALGWRWTFIISGFLGVFSVPILFIREPRPGEMDEVDDEIKPLLGSSPSPSLHSSVTATSPSRVEKNLPALPPSSTMSSSTTTLPDGTPIPRWKQAVFDYWTIFNNAEYNTALAGFIAVTFGMGGFSDWLPTYFARYYHMSAGQAGLINGAILVVGGISGTLVGSLMADFLVRKMGERFGNPYLLLSGVTMAISSAMGALALYNPSDNFLVACALLFFCMFFGWFFNGPINAMILNSCPARLRSRANGICVLLMHMLGDAISPTIIGQVSDTTDGNLRGALCVVPASMALCAFIWLCGWMTVPYISEATKLKRVVLEKKSSFLRLPLKNPSEGELPTPPPPSN